MTRTAWRIFRTALSEKADVYHFHDPELIGVGLLLRLLGKRVVYDVHEDVPKQILSKHWIRPILRPSIAKATSIIEFATTLLFDGIVAATPAIAKRFPGNKTVTVQNFPILDKGFIAPGNSYAARPLTVAYVGAMNAVRGVREMVQAMILLPKRFNATLVLAGTFDPELETEVRDMQKLGCVDFIGWQSQQRVRDLLGNARAGLVLFHPVPNHMEAQPNKLFEYMQAGIPVVASDFPLWREIVNSCNCGLLVDPLDPKAIADAIQWLLEHPTEAEAMGARGMRAVNYEYNWNSEEKTLLSLYRVISRGPQRTLQGS
jgi:glycosyltransferase involved in cell wall biosynthesis